MKWLITFCLICVANACSNDEMIDGVGPMTRSTLDSYVEYQIAGDDYCSVGSTYTVSGLRPNHLVYGWEIECKYSNGAIFSLQNASVGSAMDPNSILTIKDWFSGNRFQQYTIKAIIKDSETNDVFRSPKDGKIVYNLTPSTWYGTLDVSYNGYMDGVSVNEQHISGCLPVEQDGTVINWAYSENSGTILDYSSVVQNYFSLEINGRTYVNGSGKTIVVYPSDIVNGYIPMKVNFTSNGVVFNVPASAN